LNGPNAVALDNAGNLYVAVNGAGTRSNLIREVNADTGIITTIVGNGKGDGGGLGGSGTSVALSIVTGLAVGTPGDIYLTESVVGLNSFAADQVLEIVTRRTLNFPSTGVGGSRSLTAPLDVNASGTTITGISAPVSEGGKQEYVVGTPSCALNTPALRRNRLQCPDHLQSGLPRRAARPAAGDNVGGHIQLWHGGPGNGASGRTHAWNGNDRGW
jgi:hypothetical protein